MTVCNSVNMAFNYGSEQTLVMCRALRLHGTGRAVPSTLVPRLITYLILMISLLAQHPLAIHSQINENIHADGTFPYFRSPRPTGSEPVWVYRRDNLTQPLQLALSTAGAALARRGPPILYRIEGGGDELWLRASGVQTRNATDAYELLEALVLELAKAEGVYARIVLYAPKANPQSTNAAITYCAGSARALIAASTEDSATMEALRRAGVTEVEADVSDYTAWDVVKTLGDSAFAWRLAAFQPPEKAPDLAEYAVAAGAPVLEFNSGETAGGAGAALSVARLAVQAAKMGEAGICAALGWSGDEPMYVSQMSVAGCAVHASDWAHSLVALSNMPADGRIPPEPEPEPKSDAIKGKHTVAFLTSDGDNVQWLENAFATNEDWWAAPERGSVPIGWTVSPALSALVPIAAEYLRKTATVNDSFVAAPSGVGYNYLEMMPPAARRAHAAATRKLWGPHRVVNVIGLPGLQEPELDVLQDYAKESMCSGFVWYTFGEGYAGWVGPTWLEDGTPVVGAKVSLWGNGSKPPTVGVDGLVHYFVNDTHLPVDPEDPRSYSVVPVGVWSHTVADIVRATKRLEESGKVRVVHVSEILERLRELGRTRQARRMPKSN